MIRKFFQRIFVSRNVRSERTHRAYTLHRGNAVVVNALEKQWLIDDCESLFGFTPLFTYHRHPALPEGEEMVSLRSELRMHW